MFNFSASFPNSRPRRNRQNEAILNLLTQHHLKPSNLILPLFVVDGQNIAEPILALPDCFRFSLDLIIAKAKEAYQNQICALMLFPVVQESLKCEIGKEAHNHHNLICQTIKKIKEEVPEILVIADVALDPYTTHGHDGIINQKQEVLNDETIEILCLQALALAKAGADFIAPSDMMDGRIGKIRSFLNDNSYQNVGIFAYSAKYASNFYGPFREAVGSANNLKQANKKSYQLNYCNNKEAFLEIALDINEGADAIIIKPAIAYLDIILQASQNIALPIFGYQVSGEHAMLKLLAKHNNLDFYQLCFEHLIAIKRAGAQAIICYSALEIAKWLKNQN
jgi:porphobilinogen synthase